MKITGPINQSHFELKKKYKVHITSSCEYLGNEVKVNKNSKMSKRIVLTLNSLTLAPERFSRNMLCKEKKYDKHIEKIALKLQASIYQLQRENDVSLHWIYMDLNSVQLSFPKASFYC